MTAGRGLLLAGTSMRAAAESAARAGFHVYAVDAFGDRDQHPGVRVCSLPRDLGVPFSPPAAARAARRVDCGIAAYGASFENDPRAVALLAAGRALWGNPPGVLRRVRDPRRVADALRRSGLPAPRSHVYRLPRLRQGGPAATSAAPCWLLKPIASGGGHGVRRWTSDRGDRHARIPPGAYLQEIVPGTPGSVVFAAAAGRAVVLGVSRQIVGDPAFGAANYRYCGSLLMGPGAPAPGDTVPLDLAVALAQAMTRAFGLVGVNGVDVIVHDGVPYAIEVNPRWCASMELVERARGISVFGAHAAACASAVLPGADPAAAWRRAGVEGKAIVFARRDLVIGETRAWLSDATVRDVPHPGERIRAGRPVCTVFASGADAAACYAALVARAARVYAEIEPGAEVPAEGGRPVPQADGPGHALR